MTATTLEQLPDEVLLIVCQFLGQYDVIHAFAKLNYRLDCTISYLYRSLTVACTSYQNATEARELLKIIGPHLESVTVKNVNISPEELRLAENVHELTLIRAEVIPFPRLAKLTDLNVIDGSTAQCNEVLFANYPNQHSIYIASTTPLEILPASQNKISIIKQLAVTLRSQADFVHILRLCPQLTCLNLYLQVDYSANNATIDRLPSTEVSTDLRTFSLRTPYDAPITVDNIRNIFKHLPSALERLSIEISTAELSCLDGQVWEDYLKVAFPDLLSMELFISLRTPLASDGSKLRLPQVQKTFHSLFWSRVTPQEIAGDYILGYAGLGLNIFTRPIPTVRRRRYFMD